MKKRNRQGISMIMVALLVLFACEKTPQVYSVNNFTMVLRDRQPIAAVAPLPVKEIVGTWKGLNHEVRISTGSVLNDVDTYTAELIDTLAGFGGGCDTSAFHILFVMVMGHPYAEIISRGILQNEHDFMLPLSTYFRINKMTRDTIILQQLRGDFTGNYLQQNGYHHFVRYPRELPVYITEDPVRLAGILNEFWHIPAAFSAPDTLIRK